MDSTAPGAPVQKTPAAPIPDDPIAFEVVRAKNGLRVLLYAFATIIVSFLILLYFFYSLRTDVYKLSASDVVAIFGIVTSVVGTLVGTYFGVSAANGARDASMGQANSAAILAHQALDQRS